MGYTYDEYLQSLMKEANKEQAAFEASRRARADQAATAVARTYEDMKQQAVAQTKRDVDQASGAYRALFDANAVDELVARRDAKEAIANMNLANSGLNNTQQTAVSLQRARADADTRSKRHQTVQTIMQKLDDLRGEYDRKAGEKVADIYTQMDSDVQKNLFSLTADARERAQTLYDNQEKRALEEAESQKERDHELALAQAKGETEAKSEEELSLTEQMYRKSKHGTRFAEVGTPSLTAIKVDTMNIFRQKGNNAAWQFLKQRYNRHYITTWEYEDLMKEIGLTEPVRPSPLEIEARVKEYLFRLDRKGAARYIQSLHEQYLIGVSEAYDWYDRIGVEPES